jgi:hypothetical protein
MTGELLSHPKKMNHLSSTVFRFPAIFAKSLNELAGHA